VVALGALVFDGLRGLLREVRYADVVQQIATQPATALLWAGLATVLSYLVLTGYDFSALRYAGRQGSPQHRSPHLVHRLRAG
jgi:phosphatidylglycerol lysyltransferase